MSICLKGIRISLKNGATPAPKRSDTCFETGKGRRAMSKITAIVNVTLDRVRQAPGRPDEDTRGDFQRLIR